MNRVAVMGQVNLPLLGSLMLNDTDCYSVTDYWLRLRSTDILFTHVFAALQNYQVFLMTCQQTT